MAPKATMRDKFSHQLAEAREGIIIHTRVFGGNRPPLCDCYKVMSGGGGEAKLVEKHA